MENKQQKPGKKKINVHFWDQMVLIGIGLGLFYAVFDSVLYIFLSYDVDFFHRLLGLDISGIWTRIMIVCLFIIFGFHARYTINKRVLAESALRESEEKSRSIIETTPDGYYEVDLEGNFAFFNDSMCMILGYSRQEVSNMNQRQLLDEINSQKLTDTFKKVLESGDPVKSLSWILASKDGSRRFVESSVSLLKDPKGNPTGFGGFLRDVSQRHRAETLYRAKMAAEAASRTKSEFLASMSHEIRTPLNSIIGLVDLMLSSKLPPNQREDLDVVRSSAYSLLSIINNILDFSKIEAGKLEFEQSPFSLEHFMDDSLKIMGMKSHQKGIELVYRITPGVPDRLLGDPTRLRQILVNLVDNAIKFTNKGEVVVYVAAQALTEYGVVLNISVVDTGIGIPKDKQRSIFGAYNQVSPATVRRFGGTGLGLVVSAQLIDLMGGRINVRSQPGKGSRFRFTARFIRQQNGESHLQRNSQPDRSLSRLAGLKVLVTDDNASNRKILNEIIENLQMLPVLASSAHEAKEILLQAQSNAISFDLLILDSDMPDVDGFSLTHWIAEHKLYGAGIIMMLTFPHLKRKPELEVLGIKTSVVKPVGAVELEAAILSTLGVDSLETDSTDKVPQRQIRVPNRSLKILVAEDTPFNQRFILRLLESWNHQTTLVENGRRALEILQNETFDIVLMDVQMAEMDGLTATKEFRKWEKGIRKSEGGRRNEIGNNSDLKSNIQHPGSSIQHRVPIIAMTAHAVKGDRGRCLEAGMDVYVSKPIDTDKLFEAIETLTRKVENSKTIAADSATVDKMLLLKAFDGDWSFLEEIVEVFLSDYPRLMDDLRRANTEGDCDLLMRSAHSLKGMLKNFQAESAAGVAYQIEKKAKTENFDDVRTKIEDLTDRITGVDKMLRDILAQQPAK
jgi:two-component system sensor histidine kinase/response regulator